MTVDFSVPLLIPQELKTILSKKLPIEPSRVLSVNEIAPTAIVDDEYNSTCYSTAKSDEQLQNCLATKYLKKVIKVDILSYDNLS